MTCKQFLINSGKSRSELTTSVVDWINAEVFLYNIFWLIYGFYLTLNYNILVYYQYQRMVEIRRGLWKLSCPMPPAQARPLKGCPGACPENFWRSPRVDWYWKNWRHWTQKKLMNWSSLWDFEAIDINMSEFSLMI